MSSGTDALDEFLWWLEKEGIALSCNFASDEMGGINNIHFYSYEQSQNLIEEFLEYSRTHHDG